MQTQNAIFLTALQHFSSYITFTDSTESLSIHTYPSQPPVPVPVSAKEVDALVMVVGCCRERGEWRLSPVALELRWLYLLVASGSPSYLPTVQILHRMSTLSGGENVCMHVLVHTHTPLSYSVEERLPSISLKALSRATY